MDSPALHARSREFYDRIADGYDREIDTPQIRELRACFWERAESLMPAGARLLDFGAGSGRDAEHFAARGHTVVAYDNSPGMLAVMERRCAAQVAQGSIVPVAGDLERVAGVLEALGPFDGVVSNLAVFSMVANLDPVFRLLGRIVRPGGRMLISIQNPWCREDLGTRRFWRALAGLPAHGVMRYASNELGHTQRYLPLQLRRAARPEFGALAGAVPACACCRRSFGPLSTFRLVEMERR